MKRLFFSLLLIATISPSVFFASAASSVQVTATVGSINHSPIIVSVTPSSDPRFLARNKIQNYTLYFRDDEKDVVYYTITPASGFVDPTSGTISSNGYNAQSGAYINFTYLSSANIPSPNPTKLTITLNDGPNLVNKDIHFYIY